MASNDKLTFSTWSQKGLGQRLEPTPEYDQLKNELQGIDVSGKVVLGLVDVIQAADGTMGGPVGWYGCTGSEDCVGCKSPEEKDSFPHNLICVYIAIQNLDKEIVDNLQSLSKQIHNTTGHVDTSVFNEKFKSVPQTYYIYLKPTGRQVLNICKEEEVDCDVDKLYYVMPRLFTETTEEREDDSLYYYTDTRWKKEPTGKYTMKLKLPNDSILTALALVKEMLVKISHQSD